MKRASLGIVLLVFVVALAAQGRAKNAVAGDPNPITISSQPVEKSEAIIPAKIERGVTVPVPDWHWVDIKNTDSIRNGNVTFTFGESCGIKRGGTVTIIGIDRGRVLVNYTINGTEYGTPCPSGAIFWLEQRTFAEMPSEFERIGRAEQAEKDLVAQLLRK